MFDKPRLENHVNGERYEVSGGVLEHLKALGSVGKLGNNRIAAEVEPLNAGEVTTAYSYTQGTRPEG